MEKRKRPSFTWVYLIVLALALVIILISTTHPKWPVDWTVFSLGLLALVIGAVTWPLVETLAAGMREEREQADLAALTERVERISILLNTISEQQLLSDRARAVAFREKDREVLRRAIQEELAKQDWDAAMALANDIEREFGYKAEADRFRDEVRARRQEAVRRQIQEVVAVIDRHTRSEQWNGALREAERLMSMFPDNEQVRNLPVEIDNRRQAHKKQLLDSWNDAVARHDVDGSIEILKQLDPYLTPAEAEGMQETARQVFKEKLNLLSKQFADAVRDHNWQESIRVGEVISREFPNTRIAQEVREKMDALRQRASEPAGGAAAGAGGAVGAALPGAAAILPPTGPATPPPVAAGA